MNDVIAVLLITTVGNLIIGLAKIIAKSRCSEFSCCGCSVKRDIRLEIEEEQFEILHKQPEEK